MEEIIIEVGANVTAALTKLDALKAKVGQLVETQQGLKSSIKTLNTEFVKNEKQVAELTATMSKLGSVAGAKLKPELDKLKLASKNLALSLNEQKVALATTTKDLNLANKALIDAEKGTSGLGKGAGKAFSALKQLANIIPGLGISGILLLVGGPIIDAFQKWFDKMHQVSDATKTLKANLANLNSVVAEANKEAGKQTADLKILYAAATNVNLSLKERLAAVNALQKEFPDFFKNISTETILNGGAKKAYDDLSISILANAKAKAAKAKIDELEAKRLDNEFQRQKVLNATAAEAARAQDRILKGASGAADVTITRAEFLKVIEARRKAALAAIDINNKSIQAQEDFLTRFAGLPSIAKVIEDGLKKDGPEAVKEIETISDVLKKVAHDTQVLRESGDIFGINTAVKQVGVLTSAVDHLLDKFKDSAERQGAVIKLTAEIDKIELHEKLGKTVAAIPTELTQIPMSLVVTPRSADKTAEEIAKAVKKGTADAAKIAADELKAVVDGLNQSIGQTLKDTLNSSIAAVADALGETLAKGGDLGKAIFGNLFEILAQGLKEMGKAMIALGTAKIALDKFRFAPGLATVLAGFATVLAGSLLQNALPKFAEGGFVSGPGSPTSDSVPIWASQGEYIIKASKVRELGKGFFDMINGGGRPTNGGFADGGSVTGNIGQGQLITVQVVGRMRGKDIYFTNIRAGETIGRNG